MLMEDSRKSPYMENNLCQLIFGYLNYIIVSFFKIRIRYARFLYQDYCGHMKNLITI